MGYSRLYRDWICNKSVTSWLYVALPAAITPHHSALSSSYGHRLWELLPVQEN